jgi:hypothetical protein
VPWEFEGLSTILGLVARGIGIAAIPALAVAAAEGASDQESAGDDLGRISSRTAESTAPAGQARAADRVHQPGVGGLAGGGESVGSAVAAGGVVVRELPGTLARDVYAVARAASVRRPSVAVALTAVHAAAAGLQRALVGT